MSINCHVRIYVECDSKKNPIPTNPNSKTAELGHFDIQFDYSSKKILGHTYKNPVLSYGGTDGSQGYVRIFNASQTGTVFAGKKFKAYTYDYTASETAVDTCINNIVSMLDASSEDSIANNAYVYNVTSGPFVTYTLKNHNCFHATAIFANATGYSTLLGIYEKYTTKYKEYSAYRMQQLYKKYWSDHGYYPK